jgi:phosphinothricin acetyltransferase
VSAIPLRPARREDCPAISTIYNHYVEHDTCTYQTEPESLPERLAWFDRHGPAHPVFVAEGDGQVIGWASLSPYNIRHGYRMTVEDSIYLDPRWRGQGLGTVLLQRLIESARACGHRTIIAAISADQPASVALHARAGFAPVGRLTQVGHKFGAWLDVVYMQLLLLERDGG